MYHQRRKHGQSLVLLALLMVFVISMVGLSVDVGNSYGQQRSMQNAANAGAYSAMNAWIDDGNQKAAGKPSTWTNTKIWNNVLYALAGNGIALNTSQYMYKVEYIPKTGAPITLGEWTGSGTPPAPTGNPPSNLARIEVTVRQRVDTFFVRIVGRKSFEVNGKSDICFGGFGLGIMPIGVPQLLSERDTKNDLYQAAFELNEIVAPTTDDIADGAADKLGAKVSPIPTSWDNMKGRILFQPVDNNKAAPGTHVTWLSWSGSNSTPDLEASLTWPGNIDKGFVEGPALINPPANVTPLKEFQPGDWVNGDTGERAATKDELEALLFKDIILPFYDQLAKHGDSSFHTYALGKFRLVGFALTGSGERGMAPPADPPGSDKYDSKYIMVQYIGPVDNGTAVACVP